jgi:hypothetical protein
MPVIPATKEARQEDHKFKAKLARVYLKIKQDTPEEEGQGRLAHQTSYFLWSFIKDRLENL